MPGRQRPAFLLALLLLSGALVDRVFRMLATPTIDFFTAWSVPKALQSGPIAHIYSPEGQQQITTVVRKEVDAHGASPVEKNAAATALGAAGGTLDAPGSPLLYTFIGAISSGGYDTDQHRFQWLSLVSFVVALALLTRLLEYSWTSTTLAVAFALSTCTPAASDVAVGNVNQLELLSIALFIWFSARSRVFAAGCALGAGVMLKANLAPILGLALLFALIDRDVPRLLRLVIGAAVAAVVAVVISSMYFGSGAVWGDFVTALPQLLNLTYSLEMGNLGLAKSIFDATGVHASVVIALVGFATIGAVVWWTRAAKTPAADESKRRRDAFVVAGLGAALMVLSSNLVWIHYYVLLLPGALYLLAAGNGEELPERRARPISGVAGAVSLLLLSSLTTAIAAEASALAVACNASAIVVFVFVLIDFSSGRKTPAVASRRTARPARA